ncbi:MAG: ATP-binding protein [Planctomycetota bacterium]|jgi:serine/threonine-protein kinase RsbW
MPSQVVLSLTGPLDHLRLVWQTGEVLLQSVIFDEDPEGTRYNVLIALQELVTNVLRHGYQLDESRPIEVRFDLREDSFQVTLRDRGPAFDPTCHGELADVAADDEAMPTECGGFGIHIVRQVMDRVEYARIDGWNTLRLTKHARVVIHT